jgi:hypothetical protein
MSNANSFAAVTALIVLIADPKAWAKRLAELQADLDRRQARITEGEVELRRTFPAASGSSARSSRPPPMRRSLPIRRSPASRRRLSPVKPRSRPTAN